MPGIALSPGVHSRLMKQLSELEERKASLIDEFYPLPTGGAKNLLVAG